MKEERLNCKSARNISITAVLGKLEHFPIRESEKEAWFLSPLRSETQASFKVNLITNRWYDHGQGIGGNVIDLIIQILKCSVREALEFLSNDASLFSFHQQSISIEKEDKITIIKVQEIQHPALIHYLNSRKITTSIARHYCKEVWYRCHDKNYFAIGLQNQLGGWELRNTYFKNSSSPKTYSYLNFGQKQLIVVEGMLDLLSLIETELEIMDSFDVIVLNSISFIKDIDVYLNSYTKVQLYLDNDTAGKKAAKYLMGIYTHTTNRSYIYKNYKDLNDYLHGKEL